MHFKFNCVKRNLEVNLRNYDENPIIINDYGALFLAGWHIILFSILFFGFAFSDYDYGLLDGIYLSCFASISCIILPTRYLYFRAASF